MQHLHHCRLSTLVVPVVVGIHLAAHKPAAGQDTVPAEDALAVPHTVLAVAAGHIDLAVAHRIVAAGVVLHTAAADTDLGVVHRIAAEVERHTVAAALGRLGLERASHLDRPCLSSRLWCRSLDR